MTLDLVSRNFGIQEWTFANDRLREVFDGYPEVRDGYVYANEKARLGIEINMKAVAKYPFGAETGARKALNGGLGCCKTSGRHRDQPVIELHLQLGWTQL